MRSCAGKIVNSKLGLTGVSILFVLATLVACGGGGGSGSSTAPPPNNSNNAPPPNSPSSAPSPNSAGEKAWGTPALITTDNAGIGSSPPVPPQIAFDPNGNALAVWIQSGGTGPNLWSNRYTAGTGWGTSIHIATDNAGSGRSPQIAFDANGNALAVWEQWDGMRGNIWSNRYAVGTGWGAAVLIETDNAGSAGSPLIAFDVNGNALAVWTQSDGTRVHIWSNRYTAGTGWGTGAIIETDNAGDGGRPQVAFDASGNALAVWTKFDGTLNKIWANRYSAGTGWGTAALIETDNTGNAGNPQIAIEANGNALALWEQWDGARDNIWSNRYIAGTGWGTATRIETHNAGYALDPQIAIDANGNALAVWRQTDNTDGILQIGVTRGNIWSNRYTADTGWGTAALIGTGALFGTDYVGDGIFSPRIVIDPIGNALVVWWRPDGPDGYIWSSRYTARTGWGTAALIETVRAFSPQIAIDANGNAMAVWWQFAGTHDDLWSNRFQ